MGTEIVDKIDLAILDQLTVNARQTLGTIGDVVGLSTSATKRRIERLESRGIIRRYTAILDHTKIGLGVEAFTELKFSGKERVDEIAMVVKQIPEVQAVYTVAGDLDALVLIRVASVKELKRVIGRLRATDLTVGTKTMMILDIYRNLGAGTG